MTDYTAMKDFVTHLSEVRETSPAIAKLHNLCQAFCTLAATLLSTPDPASKARHSISDGAHVTEGLSRKRPKRTCTEKAAAVPAEITINFSINNSTQPNTTSLEETMPTTSNLCNAELPLPVSDINYNSIPYVDDDSSLWQLLDTQPKLQWLDTDLSAFDNMWGDPMLYQDVSSSWILD
jgi:hypothetical protein